MTTLGFVLAFMLWISPALAQDSTLVGHYTVAGTNPDGVPYTSTAEIQEAEGIFRLEWRDKDRTVAVGMGVVDGTTLAVVFQTDGGLIGLVSYRINGQTLTGRWIFPGHPSIMTEVLTRVDERLHGAEKGPSQRL